MKFYNMLNHIKHLCDDYSFERPHCPNYPLLCNKPLQNNSLKWYNLFIYSQIWGLANLAKISSTVCVYAQLCLTLQPHGV